MTTTRKTGLGLGEVLWDIDRLRGTRTPGGAPINFAFYAARRRLRGVAVSAVGQDAAGDELLEACRSHGIETEIARVDAPTGSAVAYLEAGEQRFRIEEEVAYDRIPCTERMLELARTAAAAAFGTLAQRCAPSRDTIRRLLAAMPAEALRLYDINLRPPFYGRETVEASLEIADALKLGIYSFNCESLQEIYVIDAMAERLGKRARISVRINPDIDAHTHVYITTGTYENKFGISAHEFDELISLVGRCRNIDFTGLHFHIGSQITDVENVFSLECERVNAIVSYFESRGLKVDDVNLGGGLGVDYEDPDGNPVADFDKWFGIVAEKIDRRPGRRIHLEPGRSIVAQCASLISRVLFVKVGETKNFLVLDAGMNALMRPALYGAYPKIENLSARLRPNLPQSQISDVVGPVCESSDVWGAGRLLPLSVRGDLMAVRSAGAYGQVMANRYNLRDFAPAVYSDDMHGARLRTEYFER